MIKMFRSPEISRNDNECNDESDEEYVPTRDMTKAELVGSSIGNFLLRKSLDEGGTIELVDEGITISKRAEESSAT